MVLGSDTSFAHDGSITAILGVLQFANPVWPGMGSELVFELWQKRRSGGVRRTFPHLTGEAESGTGPSNGDSSGQGGPRPQETDNASEGQSGRQTGVGRDDAAGSGDIYVRVLWGGQPLVTSTPLGTLGMVALPALLGYLADTIPADLVSACAA